MQPNRRIVWQVGGLLGVFIGAIVVANLAQPGLASSHLISRQVSWRDIFNFLRRPRQDKGGKGALCLLVPSDEKEPAVMWHDRPLFIWQGLEQTIGVRRAGSETVFWRRSLTQPGSTVNQIQFVGIALQPGQTYELLLFSSPMANQPVRWQPFVVMPSPNRATVTTDLQALTTKLRNEGANDEAIAQQRAQYFVDRQLEADAIQEVYSVSNPSAALRQLATDIPKRLCSSP
ncbi:MAG: hypothetical protein HC780_12635 [Leptolyngbyaceae cyanobacterium CSU_1_3]|nr:hypothetical protein [Leptolyngbyaceae cyanobacterium CSU_1_3]